MYYLVADYLVPVFIEHQGTVHISNGYSFDEKKRFYLERGLSLPRNYTIARLENRTKVWVVFFDVDNGLFLIKAPILTTIALGGNIILPLWAGSRRDRTALSRE